MEIAGRRTEPEEVAWLERLAAEGGLSRTQLAREACARWNLVDARGEPRVVATRVDLCRLAGRGLLKLPPARPAPPRPRSRPRFEAKERVERSLSSLGRLVVRRVDPKEEAASREWARVLDEHHYLGSGPLCGPRLRYVVVAEDGDVVAAVAFSAAARHVASRDAAIGWSAEARKRNRRLVISQSRFCLAVKAPNLASRVQSMVLGKVVEDWEARYGYRPVLVETYVDETRFTGSSYKASNWTYAGQTSGRGRQDRDHRQDVSVKAVWLYPLHPEWRETLRIEPVRRLDPDADWAEVEWGGVKLGDRRLNKRLLTLGRARFAQPTANLPQACGSFAATKAAYRLLNHPEVNLQRLLSEHAEASLARAAEHRVVLAIQDTTSLNYTMHRATTGLGPISNNRVVQTLGLEVHTVLLSDLDGVPLGILDMQAWARSSERVVKNHRSRMRAAEDKESRKWMRGYEAADAAAVRLEKTQVVVVGDRESDFFDLFAQAQKGAAGLLVRARAPKKRRVVAAQGGEEQYLLSCVQDMPVAGEMEVLVPRQGSTPARTAVLEVRYREVELPRSKYGRGPRSVRMTVVSATEREGGEHAPIQWMLLTTLDVDSAESAIEKVRWYARRWLIEVFHRTLKSGCKIENRQSMTAQGLEAALAIDAVVAWRVMMLVKLGREVPDASCELFFEEIEWKALYCYVHKTPNPPETPPTLREAVRMVARIGGFLARKSDGEPGAQTVWRGLEALTFISATARIFFSSA